MQAALETHQRKMKKTEEATVASAAAKAVSVDAAVAEVLPDLDLFCRLKKKRKTTAQKAFSQFSNQLSPFTFRVQPPDFHKRFLWALYLMDNEYLKCFPALRSGPEMFSLGSSTGRGECVTMQICELIFLTEGEKQSFLWFYE